MNLSVIHFFILVSGSFLVVTALLKAFYSRLFITHVKRFQILPEKLSALVAVLFIELEAGLGVALLSGVYLDVLVPVTCGMILLFNLVTLWGYQNGMDECGCYGGLIQPGKSLSLGLNLILFLLLLCTWLSGYSAPPTSANDLYVIVVTVLLVHFIAKKTIYHPLIDPLGLKEGKPWQNGIYDISRDRGEGSRYLFIFLDSTCKTCRDWLEQLQDLTRVDENERVVLLVPGSMTIIDSLPCRVASLNQRTYRLLLGRLPLAVWVEEGIIIRRQTKTFPISGVIDSSR